MNATVESLPIASRSPKGIVLYDGDCPFCRRSVGLISRLDWADRLEYRSFRDKANLPESAVDLDEAKMDEQMHVVTPDRRRVYAGFAAFRWIMARLPATWMFVPLMYVPGVPQIGQRIYLWVAKNRLGLVPCRDGQCEIPLKIRK